MGDATSGSSRTILLAVGAAALAAVAGYFLGTAQVTTTGDEPPIRVKKGSMELELLHASIIWGPQSQNQDPKRWKVDGFDRKSDEYLMYLAPTDPASCALPEGNPNNENQFSRKKVKHIAFLYYLESMPAEKHWVRFNAAGNKTRVNVESSTAYLAFLDPTNKMKLTLSEKKGNNDVVAVGYIKEIHIGRGNTADTVVCTFADKNGLDSVLIAEEPVP